MISVKSRSSGGLCLLNSKWQLVLKWKGWSIPSATTGNAFLAALSRSSCLNINFRSRLRFWADQRKSTRNFLYTFFLLEIFFSFWPFNGENPHRMTGPPPCLTVEVIPTWCQEKTTFRLFVSIALMQYSKLKTDRTIQRLELWNTKINQKSLNWVWA